MSLYQLRSNLHHSSFDDEIKSHGSVCASMIQNGSDSTSVPLPEETTVISQSNNCTGPMLHQKSDGKFVKKDQNRLNNAPQFGHLPQCEPVEIAFNKLSYSVRESSICRRNGSKCILKDLKGTFSSCQLTGILGPSGAGKSSLMNILAGYRDRGMKGEIFVNGQARDSRSFQKLSCYIMQDDCLLPHLTVMESMMVSAHLKLDTTISRQTKQEIVTEILGNLGLMPYRKTRTANLSGGQRKRLAIAQELVNNPPVMFFDEPTSGLDSVSSYHVLSLLKSLTIGGRTVICTIHQPSARLFEMFDKLYILATGQCVYDGSVAGLLPFLKDCGLNCPQFHNPADYIIEVASGEYGEVTPMLVSAVEAGKCDYYSETSQREKNSLVANLSLSNDEGVGMESGLTTDDRTKNMSLENKKRSCGSFVATGFTQFGVLFKRSYRSIVRDLVLTHTRLLSHIGIGLIIGFVYYDIGNDAEKVPENVGFLFFSLLFIMFASLMPTVVVFPMEMKVFLREHMNCWYSTKLYYLAKTLADIPFQIVFSTIYCAFVYFLTSQPMSTERFPLFCSWVALTSLAAQSMGLVIGAASTSAQLATFVGPVSCIPLLLFSGFLIRFDAIPSYLSWLSYSSYVRYSFEGILISVYGLNRTELECNAELDLRCQLRNTSLILDEYDVDEANMGLNLAIMGVFFVGLRLLGYIILRLRVVLAK